ncbi:MAG: hypothetical protein K2X64_02035, partial [Rhodocyclaceae bacterium]|nr:hypothetical protein [Rhodocyclaceae bacterium]
MSQDSPRSMLKRLESARRQGVLGDLDAHFARFIAEQGAEGDQYSENPPVTLAAALLSQLTSNGHVCLDLDSLAEQPVLDGSISAPPLAEWQAALRTHPACGDALAYTPLVLDGTRLYLRRYFDYECAVANAWLGHAEIPLNPALEAQLEALFPRTTDDPMRDQRAAARAALMHPRVLISGG